MGFQAGPGVTFSDPGVTLYFNILEKQMNGSIS